MWYTLLQLFAKQPQLLADHAQAYADLVTQDVGLVSRAWKRRAILSVAALCCAGVAAILVGVALMLWAAIPAVPTQALWVLILVPLTPGIAAAWCLLAARSPAGGSAFDNVRQQMKADMAMLREASAS